MTMSTWLVVNSNIAAYPQLPTHIQTTGRLKESLLGLSTFPWNKLKLPLQLFGFPGRKVLFSLVKYNVADH